MTRRTELLLRRSRSSISMQNPDIERFAFRVAEQACRGELDQVDAPVGPDQAVLQTMILPCSAV